MSRKWLSLALLLVLLLSAGGFAWQVALNRMEGAALAWVEARRAEGWTIRHAPPARGPIPWRPEVMLADVEAVPPLGPGARAGRVALVLEPWNPGRARILVSGDMAVRAGGAWHPVRAAGVEGLAERGDLTWLLDGLEAPGLTARRAALRWRDRHLHVTAEGLALGPVPLDLLTAVLRSDAPLASPEAFRAAGGAVQVVGAEARRGAARAEMTGSVSLDAALQPEGRGQLSLHEPAEAVRLLRDSGLLAPQAAGPLALAAQFGARVPPGGGPPRLDMPLELRGRRLSAARFPVATLPEVTWR